ncbi:dihydrolipoamide acetyltransferase family protein [Ureibacillus thermophilus]|uniref:Dihydrolipoamide acetyltransferase component of pyruvate dehydrogenase complex n=1 Tax=Ureibacillus thermophilus TaxID=367743 RepID=A0A4P6UPI2_9BACL|nr:dihydrolipoamide acetyltransferase family protein [Ureibacillus thermophilus]QBK25139.1 2-oxo acid dehydrogenase subunit E2 [Ureibacillus thermophilus]
MATEILMPKLGLTMTEGTVEHWFVNEGDEVHAGDAVAEISSEKLTGEVVAPESGTIIKIVAQVGDVVPSKEPIAYIGKPGEQIGSPSTSAGTPEVQTVKTPVANEPAKTESNVKDDGERIFITPIARKMAKELGIDIRNVVGTGGNGRITRLDILRYQASMEKASPATDSVPAASTVSYGAGLAGLRKTIAQRMMRSVQTTAQVTNHRKVDITELMKFREDIKSKVKEPLDNNELSINTLLTKAVVLALKDTPDMNAWYHNGEYIRVEEVHIGMATAVEDGLVVPVVKNAHLMSLSQLGAAIKKVTTEARQGTLDGSLYSGSTFTITNLGGYEIEYFTPILNTPEVGILGVGAIQKELALENGEVVEKLKLPLSLTYDHQIIDGAPAAEFLGKIADYLQDPYRLLL